MSKSRVSRRSVIRGAIVATAASVVATGAVTALAQPAQASTQAPPAECLADLLGTA